MIHRLLRALGLAAPMVPCWCSKLHRQGHWHDPTHGGIDRDIQEHARELLDVPPNGWHSAYPQLYVTELALQQRRDAGAQLWWEE